MTGRDALETTMKLLIKQRWSWFKRWAKWKMGEPHPYDLACWNSCFPDRYGELLRDWEKRRPVWPLSS